MRDISQKALEKFAQEKHKIYFRQAVGESVIALLPLVVLITGSIVAFSRPQANELLSPARMGIISFILPIVVISYIIFLFFAAKDIKKRATRK